MLWATCFFILCYLYMERKLPCCGTTSGTQPNHELLGITTIPSTSDTVIATSSNNKVWSIQGSYELKLQSSSGATSSVNLTVDVDVCETSCDPNEVLTVKSAPRLSEPHRLNDMWKDSSISSRNLLLIRSKIDLIQDSIAIPPLLLGSNYGWWIPLYTRTCFHCERITYWYPINYRPGNPGEQVLLDPVIAYQQVHQSQVMLLH